MEDGRAPSIGEMIAELSPFAGVVEDLTSPIMVTARVAWEHAMTGVELTRAQSRQLLVYLGIDVLRDRLIADVINPDAATQQDMDDVFLGKIGSPPPQARIHAAAQLIARLAEHYDNKIDSIKDTAPALAILAWMVWMQGGQTENVKEALIMGAAVDPSYELTTLLFGLIIVKERKPRWLAS